MTSLMFQRCGHHTGKNKGMDCNTNDSILQWKGIDKRQPVTWALRVNR